MKEAVWQTMMEWGADLFLALIGLGCAYLATYLRKAAVRLAAETEKIQNENHAALVKDAISRLDSIAERTVLKMEQTVAGDLRQAVKAGNVDRENLLKIGRRAVEEVKETAGPELMAVLEETMGDAQAFVVATIEAKVLELKNGMAPTPFVS